MKSTTTMLSLAGLATLSTAFPTAEGRNWEQYTNELGYTATRFKPGMEPGSLDYEGRFGIGSSNLTTTPEAIAKRQEDRRTEPLVGENAIPYGCDTNIQFDILGKLWDITNEVGCDSTESTSVTVKYPDDGIRKDATVSLSCEGRWPSGMQEAMIQAVQAEAIPEAVEWEEVTSRGGGNGPHNPERIYRCNVSKSSNFLSIVVRNNDGDSLVGQLDARISFTQNRDSVICGTIANAGGAIIGAINGIAGGFFGAIQAILCAGQ